MVKTRSASLYYNGEDRISRLPDNLIHHIMSFNVDTKYAVQTCVLSKRWINVWKSLPVMEFNRSSFSSENTDKFIEFVYTVFKFHDSTNIQKLSVRWEDSGYDNMVPVNVNIWIALAVKYSVQEIHILISELHDSAYEIPHHLLNCTSLTRLILLLSGTADYVDIILPRSMNLPQLKGLSLFGLSISGVELLFPSCPVLEHLLMVDCDIQTDNQRIWMVDSVSLKEFEYEPMASITVKLYAPNLEFFDCRSCFTVDHSLEICSPISRVYFDMFLEEEEDENEEAYEILPSAVKEVYAKRVLKLLGAVCMVKDLRLSPGFLEVLSQVPDLSDCRQPSLGSIQCLVLEMWCSRGCLWAVAYLLMMSPNITSIHIIWKESSSAHIGDDWDAGLLLPGMLPHLKAVEVNELEGCDAELKILSFLLKNAKVLEEVTLYFRANVDSPHRRRQVNNLKKKLRAVPTASSTVKLEFN